MSVRRRLLLVVSHTTVLILGFMIGVYTLPILIAPEAPSEAEISEVSATAEHQGEFVRTLTDSDSFHWGQGALSVGEKRISLLGELAPGPDYKLYLSPEFVETEADFERLKQSMVLVSDVKTFDNFVVNVPADVNIHDYNTVIIWCEQFSEFITAAQYR
ncbi:DM13 domain-containing protein [Umboniibacter marinipuniceus]|uniref:Electron transfer DM13 n=1 Tax=Umboniibacter marinipuniceus TaxID=569599 RepID=A0A3M0A8M8_9GAMM|nr:DM13 domain-containing protein [Umboniibacter marinipuniceus]RMA81210.1 electron transfer DM13 [Umboniibacter marinipuniceus]